MANGPSEHPGSDAGAWDAGYTPVGCGSLPSSMPFRNGIWGLRAAGRPTMAVPFGIFRVAKRYLSLFPETADDGTHNAFCM